MAASLEHILSKLLVPDNTVIQEATRELRTAFKDPAACSALCTVLCSASSPQVRQYAAILLRRKLLKGKQWNAVSPDLRQSIKLMVIHRLLEDAEKPVRTAVAQLIGTIARHELAANTWPELPLFIQEYTKSLVPLNRELGMFTLSAIASSAPEQLQPHLPSLLATFAETIHDKESGTVPYYTIKALTSLVFLVGSEETKALQNLIPSVIAVIKRLIHEDEDQACDALDFFDELAESEVPIIVPSVKAIVELCLEIISNQDKQDSTQVKAMNFISWLAGQKKKAILKQKLVVPILTTLFPIMCLPVDDDEYLEDVQLSEAESPSTVAAQVIDTMALNLPPDKLMQPLFLLVEPALQSDNPYHKKAAYLALAVCCEGCADYIRTKYLHVLLQSVCKAIVDPNAVVRSAALFTLGQFSEYLQPDISKYASELLPVFFDYLSQTCQLLQENDKDPPGISRMFYAVEVFCENLGNDLVPYLPTLMERLMTILATAKSATVRELAISAIGATANATKEDMMPYFPQIILHLRDYLGEDQPEENLVVQIQAIDTLGILARTIGASNFISLSTECIRIGLDLVNRVNDPDLRRSTYGLFAALSVVLKEEMTQYLPTIIPLMLETLQSSEGLVTHYKDDEDALPLFDLDEEEEEEIGEEDDEEDEDVTGYSVENAYLDEKEDACGSLREIASNVKLGFQPFLRQCSEETFKLIDYPSATIRKAAIETLAELCCCLHHAVMLEFSPENKEGLSSFLNGLVPKLVATVEEDADRDCVMAALEALAELLKKVQGAVLENPAHLPAILQCSHNALTGKTKCQDETDGDGADLEETAEHDAMLIEYAAEVVPNLALAMPHDQFAPLFENYLSLMLPKMQKQHSVSERSFAVGMIAQSCANMGDGVKRFVPQLMPILMTMIKDQDDEVRANAVFGLGVLVESGKETCFNHYPVILQTLSATLSTETNFRAADNICAAVARLIMTNDTAVPMEQVFPVLIRYLPLKEDFEENLTIFRCVGYLLNKRHPEVFKYFPEISKILSHVLEKKQLDENGYTSLVEMLRIIREDFPQEFLMITSGLSPEKMKELQLPSA